MSDSAIAPIPPFMASYRMFLNDFIPTMKKGETWDDLISQWLADTLAALCQQTGRSWRADLVEKKLTDHEGKWHYDLTVRYTPLKPD